MFKKFICILVITVLAFSFSVTSFADEKADYSNMSLQVLSENTGIPIKDLQAFKKTYSDSEKFNAEVEHYLWAATPTIATRSTTTPMTTAQWNSIKAVVKKGNILVTRDSNYHGYHYGHAGIVYNSSTTVETLGYDKGNGVQTGLSKTENINWWGRKLYTCKVFSPKTTSYMSKAGNYAYNNLTGIPYSALCTRYVDDFANCSSLVWKAYYKVGYNIDSAGENWEVIYPRDICESSDVKLNKSVNWSTTW